MIDFGAMTAACSDLSLRNGSLFAGLFVAGVAGSAMHCAPMCGGFVLAQTSSRLARIPAAGLCEFHRLRSAVLLPYHLGRLTSYGVLGALAGRVAGLGGAAPFLLLAGAMLFVAFALRRLAWLERAPAGWGRAIARLAQSVVRYLPREYAASSYVLGVVLGFLPCGFLYAALLAAAGASTPALGAAAMLAFGLGTVPALVVVGYAGQMAGLRWNGMVRRAAPALMAGNAVLLLVLAWRGLT